MLVAKYINFNGKLILTIGKVKADCVDSYLVHFSHNNIDFAGYWKKDEIFQKA